MKNLKSAIIGLAILVMATFPNQAKAFDVNFSDLYFVFSGSANNEYYLDLNTASGGVSTSTLLSSGGTFNLTNPGLSPNTNLSWSVVGDIGGLDVVFTSLASNASIINSDVNYSANGIDGTFGSFSAANTDFLSTADMFNSVGNSNSYANTFGNAGTAGGQISTANGTDNIIPVSVGGSTKMNLYTGNVSSNLASFMNLVATLTYNGSATGGAYYTLTLAAVPAAVPLSPSLVMFATGLVALGLIARRREAGLEG